MPAYPRDDAVPQYDFVLLDIFRKELAIASIHAPAHRPGRETMPRMMKLSSAVIQANFHWTYAQVYSDVAGGLYEAGESFFAPDSPQILAEFSEVVAGEDFCHVERLVEKMRWAATGAGVTVGLVWNAISGIEAALWELKEKYLNPPV